MSRSDTATASTPTYTMGYGPEFGKLLERRNAADCAAHLVPHLRPGMRLLDLGCGPGTISVGLADAVAPGELYGIDMEPSQVEMAGAAASAGGHANARFRTGDVANLPFDDAAFDVAHCHALLNHVPDTRAVVAEAKRVLKPGGLFSAREFVGDSCIFEPALDFGGLNDDAAWAAFLKLLTANGGHPQMGRELKAVFVAAGFTEVVATAAFDIFDSAEDRRFLHDLIAGWFFAPKTMKATIGHGLAGEDDFRRWRRSLDEWMHEPGAFATVAWGETIGRRPE